jgi:hypothetical protein
MLCKIKKLVLEQTAKENNGHAQFVEGVITGVAASRPEFQQCFGTTFQRRNSAYSINSSSQIPASPTRSVSYKIPTTSASGLFAVMVQPMGRRGQDEEPIEPIKVIFSLSNLYSVGFVYKEVFYHYEDADVSSIAVTEATERFIVKIPMDGGYMGNDLLNVRVGIAGLLESHNTLINAEYRTRKQVRRALMSIFVPISEGIRFPAWLRRLYEIYSKNLDATTDNPDDNPEKKYSGNFNDWYTISHAVAGGQVNFSGPRAGGGYNRFEVLLIQVSMLLLSAVKNAYEKNEEEKQEVLRREKEERKLIGKKKIMR